MIEQAELDRIVSTAASASLKGVELFRVDSEPTVDSEGQDALHVTIVFKAGGKARVTGDTALNAIVRIQRDLQNSGEARFPIIDFVQEGEFGVNADP